MVLSSIDKAKHQTALLKTRKRWADDELVGLHADLADH